VEFIVTAQDPPEAWKLINYIDENSKRYPSLIFDAQNSESSVFYIPYRTHLEPIDQILIYGYNVPVDKERLTNYIGEFMKKNGSGMIIYKQKPTMMNAIFSEALEKQNFPKKLKQIEETEKWIICIYE